MNVRDLVPWSRGDRERSPATRSDSLNPVLSLHREMNRLFDDVFRGFDDSRLFAGRGGWPSMDVEETDKEYRVTAELPGLEERDVERRMHTPSNARSEYPSMQVKRRVSRTKGRAAGSAGLSCRSTHRQAFSKFPAQLTVTNRKEVP